MCTSIPMSNPQTVFVNLASNGLVFPSLNFERENALSMKKQNNKRIQGGQSWVLDVDVTVHLPVLRALPVQRGPWFLDICLLDECKSHLTHLSYSLQKSQCFAVLLQPLWPHRSQIHFICHCLRKTATRICISLFKSKDFCNSF